MTRAKPPHTDRAAAPENESPENESPTGLGRSASRVSAWAANLLATALVVAAGLAFGRQALLWWNAKPEPPEVSTIAGPLLDDEASPHLLEFGDFPYTLQREVVVCNRRDAVNHLLDRCRALARAGAAPQQEIGPAETVLLRRIEHCQPLAEGDNFKLFALEDPLPLATAVVERPGPDDSAPRKRVVCWGLALPELGGRPTDEDRWTLFTWSGANAARAASIDAPPLPSGAQRLMRLAAADGSALIAFRGGGAPRDAMDFYNEHFSHPPQRETQTQASPWREVGGVWHARFKQSEALVDVQLVIGDDGVLRGMLTVLAGGGDPAARNKQRE